MAAQSPIDYSLPVLGVNPSQQLLSGMAVGQGLMDARAQGFAQQQREQMAPLQMQMAQLGLRGAQREEAAAIQQAQLQEAARQSAAVRAGEVAEMRRRLASGENFTPAQLQQISIGFPEIAPDLKGWLAQATDDDKKTRLSQSNTGFALLSSGKKDEAAAFFDQQAAIYKRDERFAKEAKAMEDMAAMVRNSPDAAKIQLGLVASAIDDKWAENATKIGTMGAEVRKAEAGAQVAEATASVALDDAMAEIGLKKEQAKRLRNQTALDWKRLNLDEKKLAEETAARIAAARRAEVELSEKQQLLLADAAVDASTQAGIAAKAGDVAAAFEAAGQSLGERVLNTGATAGVGEAINRFQGQSGTMTQARLAYSQLVDADIQRRAKESGNRLTDEDYRQQRALYPDPLGDPEAAAAWARQQERTSRKGAAISDAKAAWLGANGNLGPARGTFAIGDIVVGQGDTLQDVVKQIDSATAAPKASPSKRSGAGRFTRPMGGQ